MKFTLIGHYSLMVVLSLPPFATSANASPVILKDAMINEHEVGNGGDAIECDDGSVRMLDLYEGEVRYGFSYDLPDDLDPFATIAAILEGWRDLDPELVETLLEHTATFSENTRIIPGVTLTDVNDSRHIAIPSTCEIEQIAIMVEPLFPEERRYTISKDLWDRMDNANQAVLILHEILYRLAVERGHENSIRVRYFTAMLASTRHATITPGEYVEAVELVDLSWHGAMIFDGVTVRPTSFHPNGQVDRAGLLGRQSYGIGGYEILLTGIQVRFHDNGRLRWSVIEMQELELVDGRIASLDTIELDPAGQIIGGSTRSVLSFRLFGVCSVESGPEALRLFEIFPSGRTRMVTIREGDRICLPGGTTFRHNRRGTASFYENGIPERVPLPSSLPSDSIFVQLSVTNQDSNILVMSEAFFYESGSPRKVRLHRSAELRFRSGDLQIFNIGEWVHFDEDGYVVDEED